MAKVKNPLFSEEAHGALGGIEFRQNRYGAVVGRKSIAAYHSTQKQLHHRSLLKAAHNAYAALTPQIKAAWDLIATPPITGRNLFIGRCLRILNAYPTFTGDPAAQAITLFSIDPDFYDFIPHFRSFRVQFYFQTPLPQTGILFYYAPQNSQKPPPHNAKFRYVSSTAPIGYTIVRLPLWPTWISFRIDEVIINSGAVVNSRLYQIQLPQ